MDVILKVLLTLVPVVTTIIFPYLNYRQNGGRSQTVLMDLLMHELEKDEPHGYVVEFCIARIHNIRTLSWPFLKIVLPYGHSLEIIQLISFGRRFLDLYDISVISGRPVVRYADALKAPWKRRVAMLVFFLLFSIFITLMVSAELQLLDLFFVCSWRETLSPGVTSEALGSLLLMLFYGVLSSLMAIQLLTLALSQKRLKRINNLIEESIPVPPRNCKACSEDNDVVT